MNPIDLCFNKLSWYSYPLLWSLSAAEAWSMSSLLCLWYVCLFSFFWKTQHILDFAVLHFNSSSLFLQVHFKDGSPLSVVCTGSVEYMQSKNKNVFVSEGTHAPDIDFWVSIRPRKQSFFFFFYKQHSLLSFKATLLHFCLKYKNKM